jgi:hypothetical protein
MPSKSLFPILILAMIDEKKTCQSIKELYEKGSGTQ